MMPKRQRIFRQNRECGKALERPEKGYSRMQKYGSGKRFQGLGLTRLYMTSLVYNLGLSNKHFGVMSLIVILTNQY